MDDLIPTFVDKRIKKEKRWQRTFENRGGKSDSKLRAVKKLEV
jgi:hypothetical protein